MKYAFGQRLCGGVAVAVAVCIGLAMARSFRPAVVAVGWYGEIVPAGVHKGTVPREYLHDKDQAVMVYVPAGVFIRGTSAGQAHALAAQFGEYFAVETPQRSIDLAAYYMDKFEVTNQQYAQFLAVFASSGPAAQEPDSGLLARPPPQWSHPPRHWGGLVRCVYILSLGGSPPPDRSAMGKGCPGPQRPRVPLGEHLERRLCQQRGIDVWTAYSEPYAMATALSAAAPGGPAAAHQAGRQLPGRRESLWRL